MTMKLLDVPYYSQLDNHFDPYAACNVTSLAMCLAFYGIDASDPVQLEDELFQEALNKGINRFAPEGLKALAEEFEGVYDHLTLSGNLQDIRDSINNRWPVILHGYFTQPGHIIVVVGYTNEGFIVNDPYGEIVGLEKYNTRASGKQLHYSNSLIAAACDSWCYAQAQQRYPMSKEEQRRCNSLWIHRIEGNDDHLLK